MEGMTNPAMHDCIKACWNCRDTCQSTLYNHCLEQGGDHTEPHHVRLMADCIQICQTAADFMTRGSELHEAVCATCAEICEACAESCDTIKDHHVRACAEACRACAASCREMSWRDDAEQARPIAPPM